MFTVMFALGRLPGWIAQWSEMRKNNEPIGRPVKFIQVKIIELFKDFYKSSKFCGVLILS